MSQPSTFLIDSAVPTFQDLAFQSPIFWTTNRTYSFSKQSGTGSANKALFYLSLDGGATWTEPDSANASTANGIAVYWWDGSTKTCNIAFITSNSGSQPLKLQDFDLDVETYSALYGAVGPPTGVFTALGSVNRMADNSLMVFYQKIVSGITSRAYVAVFSGGSGGTWTTVDLDLDVALNVGGFTHWEGAIPDPTNNLCHVFYTDTLGNWFYRQITSAGVLGSITTFPAGFNLATPNLNFGRAFNTGYLRNGNLYVPVFTKTAGIFSLNEIVGSPATAPVFSISAAIDTALNGTIGSDPGQAIGLHIGTTDYVLYFIGDGTNKFNLVKLGTNSGSGWSIQTLYDATLDPNAEINPHNSQWLNTISGTVDPASGFQFQVATWHDYAGQSNLTTFSTEFSGSSSLTLSCGNPPSGQISQAYSSALAPAGGTPPYSFVVTSASLKQTNNAFQTAPGTTGIVNLLATSAGSLIVVTLIGGGSRTITGITDNSGNVYTSAGARATSGEWWSEVWYCLNALAGVIAITATFTAAVGNEFREMVAYEVSAAGLAFGSGAGLAGTSQGTAATAATIAVAQKSFIASCLLDISSSVLSVNEPFSGGATNSSDGMASLVTPTPGTYAPVFNFDAVSGFVSSIAAFNSASLGTGLPPGLTLDPATGIISGSPTLLGLFTFTVEVTDSLAATASVTCSITVLPMLPPATVPGVGGMGCLPECLDPCAPLTVETLDRFARVLARGALILAGGRRGR